MVPPSILTVVTFGDDADRRLADRGLSANLLRSVMGAAYADASQSSNFEPRSYPGFTRWAKGTGYFRDATVADGWTLDSTDNFESTVHPDGAYAVVVVGGTADTGRPDATPTNALKRGRAAARAVAKGQMSLLAPAAVVEASPEMWMLLHFHDEDASEIRLELSLPATIEGGFITSWTERIVVAAEPFDGLDKDRPAEDDDDDIDFDVRRRAS
jgi:hypothetical protein